MKRRAVLIVLFLALLVGLPVAGFAQGMDAAGTLASQSLRGYTHMFIAYALAWLLVMGWVISIARRLGRIEKALKD
jgi:hypothetical protein